MKHNSTPALNCMARAQHIALYKALHFHLAFLFFLPSHILHFPLPALWLKHVQVSSSFIIIVSQLPKTCLYSQLDYVVSYSLSGESPVCLPLFGSATDMDISLPFHLISMQPLLHGVAQLHWPCVVTYVIHSNLLLEC